MSTESTRNPALVAMLSIFGIIAVTLSVGMFLMQSRPPAFSPSRADADTTEEDLSTSSEPFDYVGWARGDAEYPPLLELEEDQNDFTADYTDTGALPAEGDIPEPAVVTQPAAVAPPPVAVTPPPAAVPKPDFREVRENAFWVQVFSSGSISRAEDVRDRLAAEGFAVFVQSRDVDGSTWYRVRLGAFENEPEAEHYAQKVRRISGFESSYVVQAPVTRRIPTSN